MKTPKIKIDVDQGFLTVEFDRDVVFFFNIYDAKKFPKESLSLYFVDVMEPVAEELFLTDDIDFHELKSPMIDLLYYEPSNNDCISPQVQEMELKALPTHLKYAYLG